MSRPMALAEDVVLPGRVIAPTVSRSMLAHWRYLPILSAVEKQTAPDKCYPGSEAVRRPFSFRGHADHAMSHLLFRIRSVEATLFIPGSRRSRDSAFSFQDQKC